MRLAVYDTLDYRTAWPSEIQAEFNSELHVQGCLVVDADSSREQLFKQYVDRAGHSVVRRIFVSCKKKDLAKYPFYYWLTRGDRRYEKNPCMDLSKRHGNGNTVRCDRKVTQCKKIVLDPKKSKQLDVMYDPWWDHPFVYYVSRRLRDRLLEVPVSGCEFIPCPIKGTDYSDEELELHTVVARLEEEADYFQLRITARTLAPPRIGQLLYVVSRCDTCSAITGFRSSESEYFCQDDLNETDFQYYDSYLSDNEGLVTITGVVPIVSARILELIVREKVTVHSNRG